MIKRALVLAGGGSKGAWQLGVLSVLMGTQARDYEIMTGVSVGALNVAGLSQTPYGKPKESIEWLTKLWLDNVETKHIYKRWFPFGRVHALWLTSVYDSSPLHDLVHGSLDQNKTRMCGRQIAVGAVCLDTGEHRYAREDDPKFADWVLASSSFPVFLKPVEIEGKLWSDGGIKTVTPLGQAIRMGADEIDVLVTSNVWHEEKWTSTTHAAVPDQVIRALGLMNDKVMQDDIELTGLKNDLASVDDKYKKVKIRVVMPSEPLIANSLDFNKADMRRMLEIGQRDAAHFVTYE